MAGEIEVLLPQAEEALITFYNNPDSTSRQLAHKWLLDLQNSEKGWQLCWKLLNAEKPVEIQYFGSCMLHYKISKCWSELPEEHFMGLKEQIINFISQFSNGPKVVTSKLCLALASFLINIQPDFWPKGCEDSINELQSKLSARENCSFILLEYMTLLPEEFSSATLTGTRRVEARSKLEMFKPRLLHILHTTLQSSDSSNLINSSLKCLMSWVEFGVSIYDCQEVMPFILNRLNDDSLVDTISELLVELLSHPSSFNQENSVYAFLDSLDGFETILKTAIASENVDLASKICKVFVSIGETHSRLLRQASTDDQQKHCLQLVKLILDCTAIPGHYPIDETCSQLTFNFWYTFQDELLTISPEQVTNYHFYLRESFVALIRILFDKVQYPEEKIYRAYGADEKEMFRCYRQDIQDTIMYICSLLREQCLQHLTELLKFLLSGQKTVKWQELEAVLYLLQGTAEYMRSGKDANISSIMSLLPSLPSYPKVMESAVYMVGSFSEWLSCNEEELSSVVPLLQNTMKEPELITASTLSLRDICRECARSFPPILGPDLMSACLDAIKSGRLGQKAQLRCVECIGYVLASLPAPSAEEQQKPVLSYLVNLLQQAIKFAQADASAMAQVHHGINCFAAYFSTFDPPENNALAYHPLLPCYCEFMVLVKTLMNVELPETIIKDLFSAIRLAVDTIRDPFFKVLPDTSLVTIELFARVPCGSILEVAGTIIGMVASVPDARDGVTLFFNKLFTECVNIIESGRGKDNPDIIHGFVSLLCRSVKSAPWLLFLNPNLHLKTIRSVLQFLGCHETPTVKKTISFILVYIDVSINQEKSTEMLDNFGQELVMNVLACVGGYGPRSNVDLFAEVIFALNKSYLTKMCIWMQHALGQDGFPSKLVTKAQKDVFLKMVGREKTSKRKIKEFVRDFSLLCRGLQGMAYATASA
eukprot:gene5576-6265_t